MKECNADSLKLYLVTDYTLSNDRSTEFIVEQAIEGGITTVQLRDKGRPIKELFNIGTSIKQMTDKTDVLFLVNDRVDLALSLDCDGVHLGQDDLPLQKARELLGNEKIIGISVDTYDQAIYAWKQKADYIAINGIFPTATKTDLGPPLGLSFIHRVRSQITCPLVGIGGITPNNTVDVIKAGCDGIAVVTAITKADNIVTACQQLLEAINVGQQKRKLDLNCK